MTERERLIELVHDAIIEADHNLRWPIKEQVADYLLVHGVKLPVTCGECEHNDGCMTDFNGFGRKDFDFCPYGERRAKE